VSKENVDIVRRATDAYRRHAYLEAIAWMDPSIVWDMSNVEVPDPEVYRGFEELAKFMATWGETWEEVEIEPLEFIDAGDQVISIVRQFGRGKLSGAEVEQQMAQLWTLREGKLVSMVMYPDRQAALDAAEAAARTTR
jgi:ketosteroid isomerase-like protein